MNNDLKEKLQSWSKLKNWGTPHWADEERFFDFIIAAYEENQKDGSHVDLEEFINIVRGATEYRLSDDDIEKRYSEYEFGISLLMYLKK